MDTSAIRHPRLLLATIFLLNGTEFLQAGMIAFAAGPIMGQIGASPEEFSFIVAVYACLAVAMISKVQWFVERLGWRRYVHVSIAVFVAGALVSAASDQVWQFLLGRSVMALGGASFMTSARGMVNLIPPGPRRFPGIAAFATSLAIGNAAAPWLASIAVTGDDWNLMFGVLIAIVLLAGVLGAICLPTERTPMAQRTRSSLLPLFWMVGGSFLVLYALQRSSYDFHTSPVILLVLMVAGFLAIVAFCRSQMRQERPLLMIGELLRPRYLFGLAIFTLCYFVLGATNRMLPLLTQGALGFPWQVVGRIQAIGLLSALFAFLLMSRVLMKYPSPKKFYVAGFGALAIFGWRISCLNGNADLWTDVLPAFSLYGVFIILVMATTALYAFQDLQYDETVFLHGQQVKNMLSQFGIGLGVATATVGFQWRVTEHYGNLNTHFVGGDPQFSEILHKLTGFLASRTDASQAAHLAMVQLAQQLGRQATLVSSIEYFWLLMWLGLLCAAVTYFQRIIK